MKVVPFEMEHLSLIDPQFHQRHAASLIGSARREDAGEAFSGFIGGTCVGAAGVKMLWKGVGEAWAYLSPEALSHGFRVTRAVRRGLEDLIAKHGLWRVQMTVRKDHAAGHRWASFLGFEVEGIMQKYGPDGADFFLYARV